MFEKSKPRLQKGASMSFNAGVEGQKHLSVNRLVVVGSGLLT